MKLSVVLILALVASGAAQAQPGTVAPSTTVASTTAPNDVDVSPSRYAALGLALGAGDNFDWLYGGLSAEVGVRSTPTRWWHFQAEMLGRAGYGTTDDLTLIAPSPAAVQLRAGPEWRWCSDGAALCSHVGVDGGIQLGPTQSRDSSGPSAMIVARAGLDAGGPHLRVRAEVEAPLMLVFGPNNETDGPLPSGGIGVVIGAGYYF
jgi:hypothetical protein